MGTPRVKRAVREQQARPEAALAISAAPVGCRPYICKGAAMKAAQGPAPPSLALTVGPARAPRTVDGPYVESDRADFGHVVVLQAANGPAGVCGPGEWAGSIQQMGTRWAPDGHQEMR